MSPSITIMSAVALHARIRGCATHINPLEIFIQ